MGFDTLQPSWIVLALFAVSALAPVIGRLPFAFASAIRIGVMVAAFLTFVIGAPAIWQGEVWRSSVTWAPEVGINWDVWVTPVGLLMALLVTGIGSLVALYGTGYLGDGARTHRFFAFLFLFAGAMLGITITEHLVVFFVFWELTSIASYLLIGHYHEKTESRKSALDALLVTGTGGVILLAGIILLGEVAGSYRIGELVEKSDMILAHPLYPAIFICFFLGAATKSAQFPFHFWLPGAMAAPAPVSAYLHSATMVKAGVFLLALMHPVLGGTDLWHFTLLFSGVATMTWGALVAAVQTDLKRLLAYTTVSALGTLVMLLGIENKLAAKTVVVFLVVHAFYKGALFMVAGILEKTTGTRDVSQLRGLIAAMPVLGIAAVLAAASMSGLPPLIGFIAKELLYEVKLEAAAVGWSILVCGVVANAANIVVALNVGVAPFLGSGREAPPLKKKPSIALWLGPAILGAGSLILGLFPGPLLGSLVEEVASQIRMEPVDVKLKLWHGFNLVLLLSALTLLIGLCGFFARRLLWGLGSFLRNRIGLSAQALFRSGLAGFLSLAGLFTRLFQSGNLRQYFIVIVVTAAALMFGAVWITGRPTTLPSVGEIRLDAILATVAVAVSAIGAAVATRRMTVILLLGCAGFGIAGIFALYGAPDLAITQLLVETLTLVLFALAIYGLPHLLPCNARRRDRAVSIAIASAAGVAFTLLTLKALALEFHEPVAEDIARRSLPEAYGRNVVNVILVDFRALDTFGEISVLLIAALGVAAMLGKGGTIPPGVSRQRSAVLLASARYTTPAMLIFSLYILLRGHNEPGGGFIGGLIAAMALVLTHLARPESKLRFLGLEPSHVAGFGLLLALLSGVPGLFSDASFLAAWWGPEFSLPAVGKVKLGTVLAFDVGVYFVVAGIVLLLYEAMERWHATRSPSANRFPSA